MGKLLNRVLGFGVNFWSTTLLLITLYIDATAKAIQKTSQVTKEPNVALIYFNTYSDVLFETQQMLHH